MKEELKKSGTRNYMMFFVGINSGMRVSDIVSLNRDDIRDEYGNMRSHITVIEKKTKKIKKFPIYNDLYTELEKYTRNMSQGDYLFKSQIGTNRPITTTQAYRILKEASTNIGLEEVGTHIIPLSPFASMMRAWAIRESLPIAYASRMQRRAISSAVSIE